MSTQIGVAVYSLMPDLKLHRGALPPIIDPSHILRLQTLSMTNVKVLIYIDYDCAGQLQTTTMG
jgi:hypothetical protein